MANIINWNFPTFEEWCECNKEYEGTIGDYNCHIRAFSWCDKETEYMCAISTSLNPLNIYSDKIVRYSKTVGWDDEDQLRSWYEQTIKETQIVWEKYINEMYING